ncbi:MAG: hypothetical protein HC831_20460 [Chloroflexia bacterium]|nr:hypothetical protein [Chloroflexia bacterium]
MSYNSGHFVYFIAGEYDSKPKTIIDFVLDYHKDSVPGKDLTFADVKSYLDSYLKGDFKIAPKIADLTFLKKAKLYPLILTYLNHVIYLGKENFFMKEVSKIGSLTMNYLKM